MSNSTLSGLTAGSVGESRWDTPIPYAGEQIEGDGPVRLLMVAGQWVEKPADWERYELPVTCEAEQPGAKSAPGIGLVKRMGRPKGRGPNADKVARVIQLRQQNWGWTAIANELELNRETVRGLWRRSAPEDMQGGLNA